LAKEGSEVEATVSDSASVEIVFLNEGLMIEISKYVFNLVYFTDPSDLYIFYRIQLQEAVKRESINSTDSSKAGISTRRARLASRIAKWRRTQSFIMPSVQATGQQQCPVEDEILYLPSDFSSAERETLDLHALGRSEAKLREGQAFDALLSIRSHIKFVNSMWYRKGRDNRGVTQHTRSLDKIKDAESRRDARIAIYERTRTALIGLDVMADDRDAKFPRLEEKDMERQTTEGPRQLGDSRRLDGRMWVMGKADQSSKGQLSTAGDEDDWDTEDEDDLEVTLPGKHSEQFSNRLKQLIHPPVIGIQMMRRQRSGVGERSC
jgi:hypothetical protein